MKISLEIKGVENFKQKVEKVKKIIPKYLSDAINNTADDAVQNISKETPIGATSMLKNSWKVNYANENKLSAKVGTHLAPHYAPDIEYGTRPHKPPIGPLKIWAAKKLGNENLAFAIAKKIAKKGTKAQKPFKKGTINSKQILKKEIKIMANKILNI